MATKRTKRIDPNAAFAAIVGTSTPTEPETAAPGEGSPAEAPGTATAAAAVAVGKPAASPNTSAAADALPPTETTSTADALQQAANAASQAFTTPSAQPAYAPQPQAPAQQTAQEAPPQPVAPAAAPYNAVGAAEPPQAAPPLVYPPAEPSPAQAQPQQAAPPADKLVQKGYYITEVQHRRLGMVAVLQGTDRSAIVRQALEMYFAANRDVLP